jgi:aspartyl-tRNA(Asn)/glutamyl-tRNA(Gln) amidotransferase subunit C
MANKLSIHEVEHIAELCKLGLGEAEIELFREQLSAILEYAEVLQKLDTEGVPPTSHVIDLGNVMRDDVIEPSLTQEEALANAPDNADGQFKVQPILGQETL